MSDLSPEPAPLPPTFPDDQYEVDGVLGVGGMAVVYRARDRRRSRMVAIKMLQAQAAEIIGHERFLREIEVAAAFSHPNIVPLLDSGEALDAKGRSIPYYVMPLIEGESLRERLQREQRLSLVDAVNITRETLEALRYAHNRGVIHRDVKPANILLSDGHAIVADFGVARPVAGSSLIRRNGAQITQSGFVVGTPVYMSPEQALADKLVDVRTDLYSVACVLYEMLTGVTPFDGPSAQAIISRKMNGMFVPASAMRSGIPRALDDILACALKTEQSDRYASAASFMNALSHVDNRSTITLPVQLPGGRVRARKPFWLALIAACGAAITVIAVRRHTQDVPRAPQGAARSHVAVLPFELLSPDSTLAIVVNGFTSDLIDELAQFPALTVISRNGVMPYRGATVGMDSIARVLNVGSLVTGEMRRFGDSVKVSVRLIDGKSSAQVAKADAFGSMKDLLAVRSNIVDSVTSFLRRTIGIQLRSDRPADVTSTEAWELVVRARALQDQIFSSSELFASRQLSAGVSRIDSMFARAARFDTHWPTPVTGRGALRLLYATNLAALPTGQRSRGDDPPNIDSLRAEALRYAERALVISKDNPDALYLRARARFAIWNVPRSIAPDSFLIGAEADLRAVVEHRTDMADAWNDLSFLLTKSGNYEGARDAAERSLQADAYLRSPEAVISRLHFTSLATGRIPDARKWCDLGRRRYPNDARFIGCEFTTLGWTGNRREDVGAAWKLLEESEQRDSSNALAAGRGTRVLLIAAIAARAALPESANAILSRVRASLRPGATADAIDFAEANVQTLVHRNDLAVFSLERYLRNNRTLRGQVYGHPWFRSLWGDSAFRAIAGPR